MPRRQTDKVLDRKDEVLELIRDRGELPTNEIMRLTRLSHSQAFYILKLLEREGLVEEVKRGKVAYWRVSVKASLENSRSSSP